MPTGKRRSRRPGRDCVTDEQLAAIEDQAYEQWLFPDAFKGMIDDVQGRSERSRKVIFGHSTKGSVSDGYGLKVISEQQAKIVSSS